MKSAQATQCAGWTRRRTLLVTMERERHWLAPGTMFTDAMPWPSVLGFAGERSIFAPVHGRWYHGWVRATFTHHAFIERTGRKKRLTFDPRTSPLDRVREAFAATKPRFGYGKRGSRLGDYTAQDWWLLYGRKLSFELLLQAARELKLKRLPRAQTETSKWSLVRALIAATTGEKELPMQSLQDRSVALEAERDALNAAEAARKARKIRIPSTITTHEKGKKTMPKTAKKSANGHANARGAGLPKIGVLITEARGPAAVAALCKPGATRAHLGKIRDAINELAEKARKTKGKAPLAKKLATANRLVRRLYRASK